MVADAGRAFWERLGPIVTGIAGASLLLLIAAWTGSQGDQQVEHRTLRDRVHTIETTHGQRLASIEARLDELSTATDETRRGVFELLRRLPEAR